MNIDTKKKKKTFNKMLAKQVQQYINKIIYPDQGDLSQGCKDGFIPGVQGWFNILK